MLHTTLKLTHLSTMDMSAPSWSKSLVAASCPLETAIESAVLSICTNTAYITLYSVISVCSSCSNLHLEDSAN